MPEDTDPLPRYMTVRQVAGYLQVNEKKVYSLAADGVLPGTRATGKWLFPRELVDRWLHETSHGGVLSDRFIVTGGEDALVQQQVLHCGQQLGGHALMCYAPTDTRHGLAQLERGRVEAALLHWGPAEESTRRHPALLRHYNKHTQWVLVHLLRREQGLLLPASQDPLPSAAQVLNAGLRWVARGEGSGTQRFFLETATHAGAQAGELNVLTVAASEREAARLVRSGAADAAPGTRAAAREFGLDFVSTGWECLDLAVSRGSFFRSLLQQLLQQLRDPGAAAQAAQLGGYDLARSGEVLWRNA